MWNPFKRNKDQIVPAPQVHLLIPKKDIEAVARRMQYSREWFCGCGARMKIRAKDDRKDGPSNYAGVYPEFHPNERVRGHSIVPPAMLNWNGLLEERGWDTDPVKCPACKAGMSVDDYKQAKREGKL